jgi:putative protease
MAEQSSDDYKLEMAFSRGLTPGWLRGVNHQRLVHARFGTKRGPLLGVVQRVGYDHVELDAFQCPLRAGDGVVFEAQPEQGGRIWEVRGRQLFFERGKLDFARIRPGTQVWKTSDPQLERELRRTFEGNIPRPKRALKLIVAGKVGESLVLEAEGCRVSSIMPLQAAEKRPLTGDSLRAQLGRLGDTEFELGALENRLVGEVILPVSELNRLRRELVGQLQETGDRSQKTEARKSVLAKMLPERKAQTLVAPRLVVLCRTLEQVGAALAEDVRTIYADFEDIRRYGEAVRLVRAKPGVEIVLATPRILKPGEEGFLKTIATVTADAVLVRNLGALEFFPGRKIGDFSLNVANPLTAELLMGTGLERVTISYDLNAQQVLDLLRAASPQWFEVTIHQHLPMFHMDYCVFAAYLSAGTDYTNCGRPCDHHRIRLRDRVGVEHPVLADVGCRNTVYHARAQSGAAYVREFVSAGARVFRIELLDEDAAQTRLTVQSYRDLLAGKVTTDDLARRLRIVNQLGVTSGTLTVLG